VEGRPSSAKGRSGTSLARRGEIVMVWRVLAPTNVTTGKTAMTPVDANLWWQYFMNHE
jgi:hypothetical protein